MDISFIFKIAAIGIIVAVLNMVLIMIIPQISNLFSAVKSLFDL